MTRFRSKTCALVALFALFCQLWMGAAHAYMGGASAGSAGGIFCGDGDSQVAERLRAQLPPELRAPSGDKGDCCNGACQLCAPLFSPALPSVPVVSVQIPRLRSYVPRIAVESRYLNLRPPKPPATGPPVMPC